MTAATPGPSGPNLFSMFSSNGDGLYRTRREAFVFSLVGQIVYLRTARLLHERCDP